MCAREKKEHELEQQRDEFFNKLWPMMPQQQWKAKAISEALKETKVKIAEEQGAAATEVPVVTKLNWSDRSATPVRLVNEGSTQDRSDRSDTLIRSVTEASVQTEDVVLTPS
jgi:hypothetical protein